MSASCDTFSLGILMLVVATGLPVFDRACALAIKDVVERKLLRHLDANVNELTASCDWSFSGGPALLREFLELGKQCAASYHPDRPALVSVQQSLCSLLDRVSAALTRECLICLDAPRSTVLEPCRHAVACAACARRYCTPQQPCPVCRTPITAVVSTSQPVLQTLVRRLV